MGILRYAFLGALLAGAPGAAWAVACTSVANGNWNVLATWGPAGTGCAGANGAPLGTPGPADTVTIATTVNITSAVSVGAITNVTGTLRFSGVAQTMTVSGNVTVGAGTFTVQNVGGVNTHTLNISGNLANAGTVNFLVGDDSANVTFNGAVAQAVSGAGATMNFAALTIASAGLVTFSRSFSVARNMTDNGNFRHTGAASRVTFNGAVAQSLLGTATNTVFQNATVALTSAAATRTLTLNHDMTVVTNLTFQAGGGTGGRIVTGASKVVVQAAGAGAIANACPTDTNDFIAGNLQRQVAAGGSTVAFPVGANAATGCRQMSVTFVGVGAGGGSVIGSTTTGDHPQIGTSSLDPANSVNRYWTLTTTGVIGTPLPAFTSYDATFTRVAADEDPGVTDAALAAMRFDGAAWNPSTVSGTPTATALTVAGETGLGDFALGEGLAFNVNAGGAGRFNAFDTTEPVGSVVGYIQTKIAGTAFNLRVVHLNPGGTALQNLTSAVFVDLMDARDNTGALANNCRASWTVIQTLSLPQAGNFNGVNNINVAFTENNAWKEVRVRIRTNPAGQTGCSSDRFAIRPASIVPVGRDATWDTAGIGRTLNATSFNGAPAHKAGRPFTLQVMALPAGATNYASVGSHTGTPAVLNVACALPTGGGTPCTACTTGTLATGAFAPAGGALTSNTATYTEAGVFTLTMQDTTYAAVDAIDTPQATRTVPQAAAVSVGRFVPDNFLVATNNVPQFRTFGSACATRSFTYVGQPFGYVPAFEPQILVTAREAGGATTTNYRECLWKITSTAPSDVTQTYTNVTGPAIDASLAANAATVVPGNGTGTVTISTSDRIAYTRPTAAPIAPFNANITLGIQVRDNDEADGQITSNTATFDGGGPGIAFDSGVEFRYGRARILNALGSEKLALPVPLRTELWTGTGFVTNTADQCTTFSAANFSLGNWQGGLTNANMDATHIVVGGAVVAGVGSLSLTAPTGPPATPGSVGICLDLDVAAADATCPNLGAVPPWTATTPGDKTWLHTLRTNPPNTYTQDPMGTAAFGLYGSQPSNFIYFRENF